MLKYQVPNKHPRTAALIHFPPNSSCPQTLSVLTVGQGQYDKLVTALGFSHNSRNGKTQPWCCPAQQNLKENKTIEETNKKQEHKLWKKNKIPKTKRGRRKRETRQRTLIAWSFENQSKGKCTISWNMCIICNHQSKQKPTPNHSRQNWSLDIGICPLWSAEKLTTECHKHIG